MAKGEHFKKALRLAAGLFVYGLTTLVFLLAFGFWWASDSFKKPGPLTEHKIVLIERGQGLNAIAETLAREGAIEHSYVFILGARVLGAQSTLQAGEYALEPAISPRQIVEKIRNGETFARRVTIPEGRTSFEIVEILNARADLTGTIAAVPPEGTLFPTTYDYQQNETRAQLIARMQGSMKDLLARLWDQRAADLPLKTPEEALVLASIIEKETGTPDERKRVAGVFINRLKKGMPLQTDPTVIYALTKGAHQNDGQGPLGRRLLTKDLEYDSPYNTYKYAGLPPGPIANPGQASLEAALQPEMHDYIFFVADGTGGHAFAKTLAEHNQNVAKWRKIRREDEAQP
jgi:UPF0755 protein